MTRSTASKFVPVTELYIAEYETSSVSLRRLTCSARNSAGGAGARSARILRTRLRICPIETPELLAISATDTPRLSREMIACVRSALASRALWRARLDRSRRTGPLDGASAEWGFACSVMRTNLERLLLLVKKLSVFRKIRTRLIWQDLLIDPSRRECFASCPGR